METAGPDDETPARPSPANVAATLLRWAALVCVGLVVLCYVLGRLFMPNPFN